MNGLPKEIVSIILDSMRDPSSAVLVNSTWRDAWFDCKKFWKRATVTRAEACKTLARVRCPVETLIIDEGISQEDIVRILKSCRTYTSLDIASPCDGVSPLHIRADVASMSLTIQNPSRFFRSWNFDALETLRLYGSEGGICLSYIPINVKILYISGCFSIVCDASHPSIERMSLKTDRPAVIHAPLLPRCTMLIAVASTVVIHGGDDPHDSMRDVLVDASIFDSSNLFSIFPGLVHCSFTDGVIPERLPATLENLSINMRFFESGNTVYDWKHASSLKHVTMHNVRCRGIRFPTTIQNAVFRRCIIMSVSVPYFHLNFRVMWDASIRIDHALRKVYFRDANVVMPAEDIEAEL